VALLYALVFMGVIGLVVMALLAQSEVQFKAADAYRDRRNAEFAVDAGLEQGLSTIGLYASPLGTTGATCVDAATCPVAPVLDSHKEVAGSAPVTLSGVSLVRPKGKNRLAIVAIGAAGTTSSTTVTFNGTAMHRAANRTALTCRLFSCWGATTELWYALDAELPATTGTYAVVVTYGSGFSGSVAVHASTWAGILQDASGAAYVPTAASTRLTSTASQISTTITTTADATLVLSAAAHADDDVIFCSSNDALTGVGVGTRLSNGPNPGCSAGFGTSYALRGTGAQTATETFAVASAANAQAVLAFRPAQSADPVAPVFGAGCVGAPAHLTGINGYAVDVACTMTSASVLTIVSTATSPTRTLHGTAILTRRSDGRVDVTWWDLRPDAA
jgi:hypothetical protein